jgi:hypothetical protein
VFTKARHLSVPWAKWIQFTESQMFKIHFNIIPLPTSRFQIGFSRLRFPYKNSVPISRIFDHSTGSTHLITFDLITLNYSVETVNTNWPNMYPAGRNYCTTEDEAKLKQNLKVQFIPQRKHNVFIGIQTN